MTGTFAYLILTSARNQLRARVARLRNPRYALALLIGVAYVWMVYLRPAHGRPSSDDILAGVTTELLPLLALAFVAWTWLSGSDRTALAFSEAEVTLLFTAPVSRRTLVLYKIARTQVKIVVTSLVWTLVFQQTTSLAGATVHAVSYWVLLSTLNLNRLGVALLRANGEVHGLRGARRGWMAAGVFAGIIAMVVTPLATAWPRILAAGGFGDMAGVVAEALQRRPASWALAPFRVLLAPIAALPGVAWLRALGPALLLLGAMLAWVLSTDAAFEESAAEASALQARRLEARRARRGAGTSSAARNLRRTIRLAPTGTPAVALLWKNAMWLLRSGSLRGMLAPPGIALVLIAALAPRYEVAAFLIAGSCGMIAAVLLLTGPLTMRNDLRSELLHLSLLKTLPLRGRDVVLAEVASSALPLAASQYLLCLTGLLSLAFAPLPWLSTGLRTALVVGAIPILVGLNGAVSMIHNALAMLFPAWVRLGSSGGGGIETLGLGVINLAFALIMLGVLLVLPATMMAVAIALLHARLPLAILAGSAAAGALLVGECVLCAWALGGSLDRIEPLHVEA